MNTDLITIAIPVYNAEKYIERTLLSALNQTYPNIEYIIIDDKGSDHSMEIIKQIKKTHNRGSAIKIIEHIINCGVCTARNTALDNATGKYFFFLDADDEIIIDCIEVLHNEITRVDADFINGGRRIIKGNETISEDMYPDLVIKDVEQIILGYFNNTYSLYSTNKLFKMSFLNKHKLRIHLDTIDDINFSFSVALQAKTIATISKVTYLYYIIEGGVSSGGDWSEKTYTWFISTFKIKNEQIRNADLPTALKIKIKKKFFAERLIIANNAVKTHLNVQHCIKDYLNSDYFDRDIWRSIILFTFYLYSKMPLSIKKITIPFLMSVKKILK